LGQSLGYYLNIYLNQGLKVLKLFLNKVMAYCGTPLLLLLLTSPMMAEDKSQEAGDKGVVAVQEESASGGSAAPVSGEGEYNYEEVDLLEEELPIIREEGEPAPGGTSTSGGVEGRGEARRSATNLGEQEVPSHGRVREGG
jgi:uncharacterized protein with LGFP repeats